MRFRNRDNNQSERQEQPALGYRGNGFAIDMPEGWQDETIYTLTGPIEDGIKHNVSINVEQNVEVDSVTEHADRQIEALTAQLQGCRLLKRGEIMLANGLEAYEAIFRWCPTEEVQLYQQQVYVLFENTAYTLTTTFTKKSRKTKGPEVDHIMMSFRPEQLSSD
jgi:hypothetical protein